MVQNITIPRSKSSRSTVALGARVEIDATIFARYVEIQERHDDHLRKQRDYLRKFILNALWRRLNARTNCVTSRSLGHVRAAAILSKERMLDSRFPGFRT